MDDVRKIAEGARRIALEKTSVLREVVKERLAVRAYLKDQEHG